MKWTPEDVKQVIWTAVFAIFVLCALLRGLVFT